MDISNTDKEMSEVMQKLLHGILQKESLKRLRLNFIIGYSMSCSLESEIEWNNSIIQLIGDGMIRNILEMKIDTMKESAETLNEKNDILLKKRVYIELDEALSKRTCELYGRDNEK